MLPFLSTLCTIISICSILGFSIPKSASPLLHQPSASHCLLSLGGRNLDVEVALDEPSREAGLMKRRSLDTYQGMLFVFPRPKQVSFWMKETAFPLSAAYINPAGRILEIHDLKPFDEQSVSSNSSNIIYVLEVTCGWFGENKILAGDLVIGLPSPSLAK